MTELSPVIQNGTVAINSDGELYRVTEVIYSSDNRIASVRAEIRKGDQWKYYSTIDYAYFKKYLIVENWEELDRKAKEILQTGVVEDYKEDRSDETALIASGQKEVLINLRNKLEKQREDTSLLSVFLKRQIAEAHNKMMELKTQLDTQVRLMYKQINKLQRVIDVIELYLGINESIVVIQEGVPASEDEPVCFRQMVLFMDEEVGTWKNEGLDYNDIEEFDRWLLVPENLQQVLPERKGLVVFKPRRFDKEYYPGEWFYNHMANLPNHYTYVLIRNGENLYRVFGNLEVGARLFPKRGEFEALLEQMHKLKTQEGFSATHQAEILEKEIYLYKRWAFLFQGLIDRTEIFNPIGKVNIFNLQDDNVRFIYDDDLLLDDGRLPFWQYVKQINSKIERGTRIFISGKYYEYGRFRKDFTERLFYYCTEYNAPPLPKADIYTVEVKLIEAHEVIPHYYADELKEKGLLINQGEEVKRFLIEYADSKHTRHYLPRPGVEIEHDGNYLKAYKCDFYIEQLYILYNPGDQVNGSWGDYDPHERKKRIGWKIDKYDRFIFNYDLLSLEDIEFYLKSRVNRKDYLNMMPILDGLKSKRLQEVEQEGMFVNMLTGRALQTGNVNIEKFQTFCWECIEWWKRKVIWKRPITQDDALACRMIEKRVFAKSNRSKWQELK